MFRYLILSLFTIGSLEQALAGGITIEADLDADTVDTPRIQRRDQKDDGRWEIQGLNRCPVTYEQDLHRFMIKDVTFDLLRRKKTPLNLIESSDKITFTLTTKYITYTTGNNTEEPTYWHVFTVTIPKGIDEDQTIKARLNKIMYLPPHLGGATYPQMRTLYERSE